MRWSSDSLREQARNAVERRDYEHAKSYASRWLDREPGSAEAHYWQGRILVETDHPQEALAELEKARELGYPEAAMERLVGLVMARGGRLDRAEELLLSDLARNPRPDAARDEALARLYVTEFRFGPAWDAIERWIEAVPRDPRPWLLRAEVAMQTSASSQSVTDSYREALSRDPMLAEARRGLADALRNQGQYEQAIVEYNTYLSDQPNDADALAGAGLAALANGLEGDADNFFDRALAVDPKQVEALTGRAAIAMRRRDHAAALTWLDRALQIDPNLPDIHYRRSLVLEGLGRVEEARTERDTTERLRREAKELDALRKQLLKSARDPELQARFARWLIEHNRADEGLIWAERVMAAPGSHPDTARLLADYHAKTGDAARANYYRALAGGDK